MLHQQRADLQGAQKWTQGQQQAEDINITVATITEQIEQVKQAMADNMLHTVCQATEDMFIPPGCRQEKAIAAIIDAPAAELHCTMVMEVNSLKRMAHQDEHEFDPESDGDEPELLSESESDSEESDSDDEGEATAQPTTAQPTTRPGQADESIPEEAAIPPMIVRPQITPGATAYVQIAISKRM